MLIEKYSDKSTIGLIEYNNYPLLNENCTDDISSHFISLKFFYDSNEINMTNLEEPIRLFIQKSSF